jgi:hypothetical protein
MRKIFENYILRKASEIEKTKIELKQHQSTDHGIETPEELAIIRGFAENLKNEIIKEMPAPMFKVGQEVYLNVFYEKYQQFSWDGGANQVIRNLTDAEKMEMPIVKITSIKVATAYFDNLVDRFIEYDAKLCHLNESTFRLSFLHFVNVKSTDNEIIKRNYGLYNDVFFSPVNFSFSPNWGLYEASFLSKSDGKYSKLIWETKHALEADKKILTEKLERVNDTIRKLRI